MRLILLPSKVQFLPISPFQSMLWHQHIPLFNPYMLKGPFSCWTHIPLGTTLWVILASMPSLCSNTLWTLPMLWLNTGKMLSTDFNQEHDHLYPCSWCKNITGASIVSYMICRNYKRTSMLNNKWYIHHFKETHKKDSWKTIWEDL